MLISHSLVRRLLNRDCFFPGSSGEFLGRRIWPLTKTTLFCLVLCSAFACVLCGVWERERERGREMGGKEREGRKGRRERERRVGKQWERELFLKIPPHNLVTYENMVYIYSSITVGHILTIASPTLSTEMAY